MKYSEKIAYNDAYSFTSSNKERIFTHKGDGKSGFERSRRTSFPSIAHKPKFKIDPSGLFFTIGSCFARNIEFYLAQKGVDSITSKCIIPDEYYEMTGAGPRNGALNAYTPNSMLQLIKVTGRADRNAVGSVKVGDDEFVDMLVHGIKILNKEQLNFIREKIFSTYDNMKSADTYVITLGYTEAWYDLEDQIFVNRSPAGSRKLARVAPRYAFYNISPPEACATVEEIVLRIRDITDNRAKIILTTSPVPLHGTWTDRDIVSANLYSKSALLSAAVFVSSKYDFVDYYPSYELVIFSNDQETWEADGIHVKPAIVKQVIDRFGDLYF